MKSQGEVRKLAKSTFDSCMRFNEKKKDAMLWIAWKTAFDKAYTEGVTDTERDIHERLLKYKRELKRQILDMLNNISLINIFNETV